MQKASIMYSDAARELMKNDIVVDLLGGSLQSLGAPGEHSSLYGEMQLSAGVDAIHVSVATFATSIEPFLNEMFDYMCLFRDMSHRIMQVRTVADILTAHESGKVGVIIATQGMDCIGRNLRLISVLSELGLKIASLTYNERNHLGSGCMEPDDGPLTLVGRGAVRELRHNRIALDLSHVGYRTSMEAMEYYDGPVLFTHSNAYTLTPTARNIKDDQIRAAAQTGGLVGLTPFSAMCRKTAGVRPTIDDYIDHMEYVISLIGVDHVAIGTDFFPHSTVKWANSTKRFYPDMIGELTWPTARSEGIDQVAKIVAIPDALEKRGFSKEDIRKIMGGNAVRVLRTIWGE
ncbi:dipeptidase [Microvirga alba]|uniref:Dipeptidase n=1 Tax=Microvirga alba TaxID=2791025 RepID=A0A931FRE3_9HYPH|nr:membrane dipeptidase [Microvirga alba]MBF9235672.1 dipeptidase [Microvirga alba]